MAAVFAFRFNGFHLGRFAVAAVFLFSFSDLWANCYAQKNGYETNWLVNGSQYCYYGRESCGASEQRCSNAPLCGVGCPASVQSGNRYFVSVNTSDSRCTYASGCSSVFGHVCYYDIVCTTQSEADSVNCEKQGNVWQNGECQGPIDSTACDSYRQECVSMGGRFVGNPVDISVSPTGCLSFCDLCSSESQQRYRRAIAKVCCGKGQVPPENVTSCVNNELSGSSEMSFSSFDCDNRGGFDCSCEEVSSENSSTYQQICIDDDWPESSSGGTPGSSSSGEGGESSGGESPYPEGCDECPWLDSILDTLTLNKWNTDDIVACLTTPGLCAGLAQDTFPVFAFDTAFNNYLKPLMDSTLKVDSLQLKALLKLDTSILKQLKNDTLSLKNDTTTWHRLDALGNVINGSITTANDTTRKWFRRIADSIGVSTDSLAAHLDSILEHIPDSILDSIVKYQRYATDNFDSVLFGHGKGFSLVDSLIDSSVKYFKESNQKWNEYISMYGDSTQKIHEEIIDLPGRNASAIGYALGYGDTASTTLRGDLNGIREAIEGLGDTNGLGGHGGGYGDSLGRYRDSINKYYISDERFGELVDSTEAAWGVDSLDARWDSSYAYGLCNGDDCPPCSDDSCMGSLPANFVQRADSIARIAGDSLEASTKRQRDSLPTFWDSTFKELKEYSWFGSFDSTFLANIGAKIPNSNTCPEHCFAMDVNGTYAYVGYNMHLDWKLCRPIAPNVLNSLNAFDILKLLARVLTVVTCLSILMWEVSSRRGGGIGL